MSDNTIRFPLKSQIHLCSSVEIGEQSILFVIDPPPQSMGRILGSGGKTINALRVIAKAICAPYGFRGIVEVVYREKDEVPLSKVEDGI